MNELAWKRRLQGLQDDLVLLQPTCSSSTTRYGGLDTCGAELLFQVLTEREEKNSTAIASNESFAGWTKTFTDPACAPRSGRPPHLRRKSIIETGTSSTASTTRALLADSQGSVIIWA
ncbi:MAG: ATP-binding protein [Dermatophilaceae bacterium]